MAAARVVAKSSKGHFLILGYSNLAKKIMKAAMLAGYSVVIIDEDDEVVSKLVNDGKIAIAGMRNRKRKNNNLLNIVNSKNSFGNGNKSLFSRWSSETCSFGCSNS